ncbi:hypothetical protein XA68_14199 [Ophiocordyceps unilateralis]|uniref:Uncharacterized protein n=1 Tax=Ophiocordyceps unilateralis TaxID=268505 RepID=A0A2A9PB38_OPHUN|nr:hypothetical protein XA68_14199 [Ophiocordyceps unilateralis]
MIPESLITNIIDMCGLCSGAQAVAETLQCVEQLELDADKFRGQEARQSRGPELQIDKTKSKLRALPGIRRGLTDYWKAHKKHIDFARVAKFAGNRVKLSSQFIVKAIAPISFGLGLTRAAALTAFIPIVRCVSEDRANKEAGQRECCRLCRLHLGDVLLFTPMAWVGVVIAPLRTLIGYFKNSSPEPKDVRYFFKSEIMLSTASTQRDHFCQNNKFISEVIAVEFAAAKELSVAYITSKI